MQLLQNYFTHMLNKCMELNIDILKFKGFISKKDKKVEIN